MKALVFSHEEHEGPALFGDILKEKGYELEIILMPDTDVKSIKDDADFLLVMGGPMGVYEADKYAFINDEVAFIKRWIAAGKPILGVCLGSQLMAKALGENVYKGKPGQEIGWYDITVKDETLKILEGPIFHWHGDTFDLPQDATLLASSEKYAHQAFMYGTNALALQFHPEVTAEQLEGWYPSLDDKSADKVRQDTKKYIAQLNKKARMFFESWMESVNL